MAKPFLEDGYTLPKTQGNYMKLEKGDKRPRIKVARLQKEELYPSGQKDKIWQVHSF